MQTKFVEANGLRFEVLEEGTGDRLALCLYAFRTPDNGAGRNALSRLGGQSGARPDHARGVSVVGGKR